MMKIVFLALFVAAASASVPTLREIRGIVSPVERCPAQGLPLQLRVSNCEGAPPCTIVATVPVTIEGDFIPSGNSANAKFRLIAYTSLGEIVVSDGDIGPIVGGVTYSAGQTITISTALVGERVTVQLDVRDEASGRVEICVRAPMDIAAPPTQ